MGFRVQHFRVLGFRVLGFRVSGFEKVFLFALVKRSLHLCTFFVRRCVEGGVRRANGFREFFRHQD